MDHAQRKTPAAPLSVEDRVEIADLLARYCLALDGRDWGQLERVFTEDATAEYGPAGNPRGLPAIIAVVRASLKDGHLPEARFAWEPMDKIQPATPDRDAPKTLVRRITAKPIMLSGSPTRTHEDGWLLLGPQYGSVDHLTGPFIFSGGWWNREIHREYYYAQTRRGDLLWIFYDRVRRRWFLQGAVE